MARRSACCRRDIRSPGLQHRRPARGGARDGRRGSRGSIDSLVVLAYLPGRRAASSWPRRCPRPTPSSAGRPARASRRADVGPTLLASATNKGKFLVELRPHEPDIAPGPAKSSRWTRQFADDAEQQANVRRLPGRAGPPRLHRRRDRLRAPLPAELAAGLSHRRQRVVPDVPQGRLHAAGTHSKHAPRVGDAGGASGYHVDSYCQQCHTTGFGLPGGFESVAPDAAARRASAARAATARRTAARRNAEGAHAVRRRATSASAATITRTARTFDYDAVLGERIRHGAHPPVREVLHEAAMSISPRRHDGTTNTKFNFLSLRFCVVVASLPRSSAFRTPLL